MRYLPIFAGVMMATAFSLSVLYDGGDVARAAWLTGDELLGMFAGFASVALPAIFFASAIARRGVPRGITRMTSTDRGVELDLDDGRTVMVARARVRGGFVDKLPGNRSRVSLELAGGVTDGDRVVLEVNDDEAAALGDLVGAAPRFVMSADGWVLGATLSAGSAAVGWVLGALVFSRIERVAEALAITQPDGEGFALGVAAAAIGLVRALSAAAFSAADVIVGIDGLRIEGALRKRFIPFSSIRSVKHDALGVHLRLSGGERVRLGAPGLDRDRARSLVSMIEERISDTMSEPASPRVPGLAQGSVGAWRRAIEEAIHGTDYRGGAMSNESLARSLGTPGLSAEERVATAIALLARGEEPARIRIAACGVADDSTRAALERLAEGEADDAALEALLAKQR